MCLMNVSLLAVLLAFIQVSALVTTTVNDEVESSPHTYLHVIAQFGPQAFTVEAPLILANPPMFCGAYDDDSLEGKIVLIKRGNCSFVHKVYAAQQRGAVGVVVGNNQPDATYQYVNMGTEVGFHGEIVIPSVFISTDIYERLEVDLVTSDEVHATLDDAGAVYLEDLFSSGTTGYIMMLVPVLWCLTILAYVLRRYYLRRQEAFRRAQHNMNMPLVPYESVESSNAAEDLPTEDHDVINTKIHNESCAICLEDFKMGDQIKVLPCRHGFHGPCIDPWINQRSDLCPICKASIFTCGKHDEEDPAKVQTPTSV